MCDDRLCQYLATCAVSCPLARRQFNEDVQYANTAICAHTMSEASKAAVEPYATSLLPPTAMCELVFNLRAPKSSWRALSELYMLCMLQSNCAVPGGPYARPVCNQRYFQAHCKELVSPVEPDNPVAAVLPKATAILWPFASCVKYVLSRPGLVRSIAPSYPLTFIVDGMPTP